MGWAERRWLHHSSSVLAGVCREDTMGSYRSWRPSLDRRKGYRLWGEDAGGLSTECQKVQINYLEVTVTRRYKQGYCVYYVLYCHISVVCIPCILLRSKVICTL